MSVSGGLLKSLDESAFTGRHGKIYGIALLVHLSDGFDIQIMGFVLPSIIAAFHLTGASAGFLGSAVFFGMFVGAGGGGLIADAIGRKKTIMAAILLYGVTGLLAAVTTSYWTLWVIRVIEGIGLGAEVILIFSYLVEFVPVSTRGMLVSSTVFFWQISSFIAALIAIVVIPAYGWRGMFVIGAAPSILFALAWLALPESVRFLIEKGRVAEAEAIVRKISTVPVKAGDATATKVEPQRKLGVSSLLGQTYRKRTIGVWAMLFLQGFVFFGIAIWLPSFFLRMGFSFVHSLFFTALITGAGAIGNVAGGILLDRWGRRPTIVTYFILGGLALGSWGLGTSATAVIIIGMIGAFFAFGALGPLFTYVNELYPTSMRATGAGFGGSWQRIGGIVAPYVLGLFFGAKVPVYLVFGFVGALMVLCGIIAWLTVIETKLETLEQIQRTVVAQS